MRVTDVQKKPPQRRNDMDKDMLRALWESDRPTKKIAEELGISADLLSYYWKAMKRRGELPRHKRAIYAAKVVSIQTGRKNSYDSSRGADLDVNTLGPDPLLHALRRHHPERDPDLRQ